MQSAHPDNSEQAKSWNGLAGRGWIEAQDVLEEMLRPFEQRLVTAVSASTRGEVLDVGCGTGGTTLAVARLASVGRCSGIDISEPMLAVARNRAQREESSAEFICADAQVHAFEAARFDMIVSRLGVMFFADPVQAFANLRRCTREGGSLWFAAWRGPEENPFMTTAERIAAPLLPDMTRPKPDAPGPIAFADRDRVHRILHEAGWNDIEIEPLDLACSLREKDLVRYLSWVGPVGRTLQQSDEALRARVMETILPAFAPFIHGAEVRFTGACWAVGARR